MSLEKYPMTLNQTLEELYIKACELELQAFKPGNVSIYSDAHDMTAADFITSARVSAPHICNKEYALGEKIFYAIKATRGAVGCNTNLGIVLLCAPLVQAYQTRQAEQSLRSSLHQVLISTTHQDCFWVYEAIRLASPGGLGKVEKQDVHKVPDVTLTEAMAIASETDLIAKQYVTDFREIFDFTILEYNEMSELSPDLAHIALLLYAEILKRYPDSHIQRKYGNVYDAVIAEKMSALSRLLQESHFKHHFQYVSALDEWFKTNKINPGTTADMIVATFVTVFLEQLITNS